MIKDKRPLAMFEVTELAKGMKETDKLGEMKAFIKKFSDITPEKARKLKEEIQGLDIIKLKETDIIKIVDILPENAAELNKIFTEIGLDADETNKILDAIKKNI